MSISKRDREEYLEGRHDREWSGENPIESLVDHFLNFEEHGELYWKGRRGERLDEDE